MVKKGSDVITIMRNVTGRKDASDPQFSDGVMLGYANDFLGLIMPQEVRLYENKTWYEFNIGVSDPSASPDPFPDPFPVDLSALGYTTIGPPAYISGNELQWFQSPGLFFSKWPETQTYTQQRPVDVLFYNKELIFRGPPDQTYNVKIAAYKVEPQLNVATGSDEELALQSDYFWRYVAYGGSLDLFSDYGEMDEWNKYYPVFKRYRSLVYARTNQQLMSQRTFPTF